MRFIDMERIRPEIRSEIALLEEAQRHVLNEADPVVRGRLIDSYQPRWVALRPAFARASFGKCWYLECKTVAADDDIDHFRPKKRVDEDPTHPGYYWLALTWTNFRLSSQRANRPRKDPSIGETAGKADHFPLLEIARRARLHTDPWEAETPALLDPTNPLDPPLLSFQPNGEVALAAAYRGKPAAEAKFKASLIHLSLNWPPVRDARLMLYNEIERAVARGAREAPADYDNVASASAAFLDAIRDIVSKMRPEAEYSAAARVYVEHFGDVWWIKEIVLRLAP